MRKVNLLQDPTSTTIYYHDATNYDDLRFPLTGERLDTTSGRLDYDFTECTVDFASNARYPEEPICIIAQMPHSKKFGSSLYPHLHWVQSSEDVPNWLIAYRFYNNGEAVPSSFTLAAYAGHAFTYTSGDLMQITSFAPISPPLNEDVSAIMDIKLFRDSTNVSTLFAGADPLSAAVKSKEFDFHFMLNSIGSGEEYVKK